MTPAANTLLPLIIISLGLLGVILSFLVPDRKKANISLGLAGLIIISGVIGLGSQSIARFRWNQRMKEIQRDRQTDLDTLRQRMKDKVAEAEPAAPVKKK